MKEFQPKSDFDAFTKQNRESSPARLQIPWSPQATAVQLAATCSPASTGLSTPKRTRCPSPGPQQMEKSWGKDREKWAAVHWNILKLRFAEYMFVVQTLEMLMRLFVSSCHSFRQSFHGSISTESLTIYLFETGSKISDTQGSWSIIVVLARETRNKFSNISGYNTQ